jgi:NAD-dependent dihydropyrimidine dehydrogenase PreA subunit
MTDTARATRDIVHIDEDRCDGCGLCVPSCAEGAIRIVDGKATLQADNLCDGLGNCLGVCPKGAITIQRRQADAFDEQAVQAVQAVQDPAGDDSPQLRRRGDPEVGPPAGGCPGARMTRFDASPDAGPADEAGGPGAGGASALRHWPVKLALLSETGELWNEADVLLAADCAAFAMGDFHAALLSGKTLAIACPKLDETRPYVEKLARLFARPSIRSLTVARMQVPCCGGLEHIVHEALVQADRTLPVTVVTVGAQGNIVRIEPQTLGA